MPGCCCFSGFFAGSFLPESQNTRLPPINMKKICLFFALACLTACESRQPTTQTPPDSTHTQTQDSTRMPAWAILPFVKVDSVNPVLLPIASTVFFCPVRKKQVHWEEHDVYNPAAVVKDGKVFMLYRAEDTTQAVNGTSRLGLAESTDGIHFKRLPEPVFYPDNDALKPYEWMGGCEDPRVVEDSTGTYFMTYTAYDGKTARLCVASSIDLKHWKKHGLAFGAAQYRNLWSKSGAVVCRQTGSRMVAVKIKGKYWMYWGENGFLATSDDLMHWDFLAAPTGEPTSVLPKRAGQPYFDNALVEPGPPALLTEKGILLLYNGASLRQPPETGIELYAGGQALFDKNDPAHLISRLDAPFLKPEKNYELVGQVNKVTFVEGMVFFQQKWFLYYGTADSKIAVAVHALKALSPAPAANP